MELFLSMDDIVFMLDEQRQVTDANNAANLWLEKLGLADILPCDFMRIMKGIENCGGIIRESLVESADMNVFLNIGGVRCVYTMTEHEIYDEKKLKTGSFIRFSDITQYSKIITQLEHDAQVDILTNMFNRRGYERKCTELDKEENLPISVVMADVNGLKKVNDHLGHHYGDEMLRIIANSINRVCPENAIAARIGGDEFVIIAPKCTNEEIQAVLVRLKELLCEARVMGFKPTVAVGVATKTIMDQDLKTLILEADRAMYQQKEYDRRKK